MQHPLDAMLFHPLAEKLAQSLSATQVTPNMVSASGGLMVVLAGVAYAQGNWPWSVLLGFLLHASWHVLDGADGDLARICGKASPQGEIFDGICDYLGHISLYLTLIYAGFQQGGWTLLALGLAAGASRVFQANFHESQRRQFMHWIYGTAWLRTERENPAQSASNALGKGYLKLAEMLAPGDPLVDAALAGPARSAAVKKRLEELGPGAFAGSSLLGAPYRTLALGAAMLAGSPIWYFLYEIIVLNLVLAQGVYRSRRSLSLLQETIGASA